MTKINACRSGTSRWLDPLAWQQGGCNDETETILGVRTSLTTLLVAQSAFATRPYPPEMQECGPNPFYSLVAGMSQVCSERDPARAALYQSILARVMAEYPQAYAQLDADPVFRKELAEVLRELRAMKTERIHKECAGFLVDGQG